MTEPDPNRWGARRSDAALAEKDWPDHPVIALETAKFAPVFPCGPNKRPAIPKCRDCDEAGRLPGNDDYIACARSGRAGHGFYDAITDPERIRSWWGRHPDHLVGIPTAGLLVVDLDEPDPPTGESWAWWVRTAEAHDYDPVAPLLVATPSCGVHVYFVAPDGADVRNSARKLAPCVDVRAQGGYVIAPGCRLPDGRRYEILEPSPAEVPVAPGWLVEMCRRRDSPSITPMPGPMGGTRYGIAALESELGRLAIANEGERNNTLFLAAARIAELAAGGELDAHRAIDGLLAVASRVGLDEREATATIASGMRKGAQAPRKAS